ncbi:hypothetical protein F4777DRAFT_76177 [Nemania sp. FL0916]|nr:hypothetical protein F4777DRAFT_76177 [Nemania sp. FL0916]
MIILKVADESNGMFRWAYLQIEELKGLKVPVTSGKVEQKLKSLPKDLDETYVAILNRLDDYDKPRVKNALRWLTFSVRQLYIEELVDASAINIENNFLLDDTQGPSYIATLLQDLVLIQPPLSPNQDAVEHRTHTVILVHASIREFLLKGEGDETRLSHNSHNFGLSVEESNYNMALSCLMYLLAYNTCAPKYSHQEYPLRQYAWYHWAKHIYRPEHPNAECAKAGDIMKIIWDRLTGGIETRDTSVTTQEDSTLLRIINRLAHIIIALNVNLQLWMAALNIPIFHPDYDSFMSPHATDWSRPRGPSDVGLLEIMPATCPETKIQCRMFEIDPAEAPSLYNILMRP